MPTYNKTANVITPDERNGRTVLRRRRTARLET